MSRVDAVTGLPTTAWIAGWTALGAGVGAAVAAGLAVGSDGFTTHGLALGIRCVVIGALFGAIVPTWTVNRARQALLRLIGPRRAPIRRAIRTRDVSDLSEDERLWAIGLARADHVTGPIATYLVAALMLSWAASEASAPHATVPLAWFLLAVGVAAVAVGVPRVVFGRRFLRAFDPASVA